MITQTNGQWAHLSIGKPPIKIVVDGETILFEDHHYCGPMPTKEDGSERQIKPNHRFWTAVSWWYQQGKRVSDGVAVWDEVIPTKTLWVAINRRNWVKADSAMGKTLVAAGHATKWIEDDL